MALLNAATSAVLRALRIFHSSFFSANSSSVCLMKPSSASTCDCSSFSSDFASSLFKALAPVSFSIFSKASSASVFCFSFDFINFSCSAMASASFFSASFKPCLKVLAMSLRTDWILNDRALYFFLKVAFLFSFFQSGFGTSPVSKRLKKRASPAERVRVPKSTARCRAAASSCKAANPAPTLLGRCKNVADAGPGAGAGPPAASLVASSNTSMALSSAAIAFVISSLASRNWFFSCSRSDSADSMS
mmetsp:Transcript_100975/g.200590  ORF Transcript_100975/g.200590 Transcript_100975/m.200590 type:complete len:247 (-) Transcript_100975:392-1132(-)